MGAIVNFNDYNIEQGKFVHNFRNTFGIFFLN